MDGWQQPRTRYRALALAAGISLALAVLPSTPALAFDAAQDRIVTDNPADWTPDVVSAGSVRYLAQAGSTMVAEPEQAIAAADNEKIFVVGVREGMAAGLPT